MFNKKWMNEYKRLLVFIKPRIREYLIGMIGICFIQALSGIIFSYFIKDIYNGIVSKNSEMFMRGIIFICAARTVQIISTPILGYMHNAAARITVAEIRIKLFKHILEMPVNEFEKRHSGDFISRLTNDVQNIEDTYSGKTHRLIHTILTGTGSMAAMVLLSWQSALVLFLLGIVFAYISITFAKPIRKISEKLQKEMALVTEKLTDLLSGFSIMKMFHIESTIAGRFNEANNNVASTSKEYFHVNATQISVNVLIKLLSYSGIVAFGSLAIYYGYINLGILISMTGLMQGVNVMFTSTGEFVAQIQISLAGAARVFEFLDIQAEPERGINENYFESCNMIELRNVCFRYGECGETVLDNINITVKKGEVAALVGQSGAGKSTIIKLLLGYYPLGKGGLVINGKPADEFTLNEMRQQIAYVPQDAYLFDGTVIENISFGKPDATKEEIIDAANASNAHDFIMGLPDGYDTVVGERGVRLSGGQRQRIAIARAILKNAPILLLDEATSSLDSESEFQIQEALQTLMKGRTVIAVAHRLSTIEHADTIYAMEDGRIIEEGNHKTLIDKDGLYKKLYDIQFKERIECL